jgi:hypothetical protein
VNVVSTSLLDTSSGGMVGVLVDGALELLQELVDVEKVALGSQIRQRQRVGVMHRRVRGLGNHGTTVTVL